MERITDLIVDGDADAIAAAASRASRAVIARSILFTANGGDAMQLCRAVALAAGIKEKDVSRWVDRERRREALKRRVSDERIRRHNEKFDKMSSVYFVRSGDAVKIGVSGNVRQRMIALTRPSCLDPMTLLKAIPGGRSTEREWHDRFRGARIRGEWFRATPELLKAIEEA